MKLLHDIRGFSAMEVAIIVIAMGCVGGSGYYVYQQNSNKPEMQQSEATPSEVTEDEQAVKELTYRNDEYGFYFTYPSDWNLEEKLQDEGRGGPEGTITLQSPQDSKIIFTAYKGGKGGMCSDPLANDEMTARVCPTIEMLTIEPFDSGVADTTFYYNERVVTPPTVSNAPAYYTIGLTDNNGRTPTNEPYVTDVDVNLIRVPNGYLEIMIDGPEGSEGDSKAYFETAQTKEVRNVLKSLQLFE